MKPAFFIAGGCPFVTSTRYRCIHLQEQLAANGMTAQVEEWYNSNLIRNDVVDQHEIIVLHRVAMSGALRRVIERAHEQNKFVLFDTDDLIFEPHMTQWHRGVQQLLPAEQLLYSEGVQRYLATLEAADYVITSTPLLAELAKRHGKRTIVHRNALGREMMQLSTALYQKRSPKSSERVIIGYGSGTATHDVDFEQVAPALVEVLATHSNVELWLVGPLQLPDYLSKFETQIRRFPLTDWQSWFKLLARFDINLAPLEMGNLFCRAKSEIKFVEAGAVGVATIASQIDPFVHAIQHGENGLLASKLSDWLDALKLLVTSAAERERFATSARHFIEQEYSPEARSADLAEILPTFSQPRVCDEQNEAPITLSTQRQPDINIGTDETSVPLVINWLVTEPFPGSGGHTGVFRMIRYLVEFGHECHIYMKPANFMQHYNIEQIRGYIDLHFGPTGARYHTWNSQFEKADATFATYWVTAYDLDNLPDPGRRLYFVQDFEPYFFPIGDEYIQAENSYRLGLHCVTLGPWLAHYLTEHYQVTADSYDFAVDHSIFWVRPGLRSPSAIRLCFYARPSTPRRGYELGIAALQAIKLRHPELEVYLFGANDLPRPPAFAHINRGVLTSHQLAELFSSCDIGLVFSLTNPSFTPFEMMACGCAVVDLRSERVVDLLQHGENAMLAESTVESVAEMVIALIENKILRQKLVDAGLSRVSQMDWRQSARQLEQILLKSTSPLDQRWAFRRQNEDEATALRWQIHSLLDVYQNDASLTERLQATLKEKLVQNAELKQLNEELIQQKDELAQQLQPLVEMQQSATGLEEAVRLIRKIRYLLRKDGVGKLSREIVNYIRWRLRRQ